MPNEANRQNLKAQMDCLSATHLELTILAAKVNSLLLKADARNQTRLGSGDTDLQFASRSLERLIEDLYSQQKRCKRVRKEIEEIRDNLRTN